jgi:RNA polymerase sigma factor (sigma-70 family)
MDVLADAWAIASEMSPVDQDEAGLVRGLAREASARHKRLMRHEVSLGDSSKPDQAAQQSAMEAAHHREQLWLWLDQLLARLSDRQRVAIERHLNGVSDAEIAAEIGCTAGTVRVLRARGMASLKQFAPPADEAPKVE